MLNALANHNYLPHNGQNITQDMTTTALDSGLNIPPDFGALLHMMAVRTNPDGNATNQFNLDHLARHDILEHDASLSRQDIFFGNNLVFNETIFNQTRSHWQDTIDVQQAAVARLSRLQTSNETNPEFGFTKIGTQFSVGESAAYIIVLGDKTTRTVNKTVVEYLFGKKILSSSSPKHTLQSNSWYYICHYQHSNSLYTYIYNTQKLTGFNFFFIENERLPTEVGWSRATEPLNGNDLFEVMQEIANVTADVMGTDDQQVRRMLYDDPHARAAREAM